MFISYFIVLLGLVLYNKYPLITGQYLGSVGGRDKVMDRVEKIPRLKPNSYGEYSST